MKYIIDLPDTCQWVQWVMTSDKDGHAYFDFKSPEDLTPLDKELSSELGEAYHKGFEAGQHEATTLEYEQGLDDAWKAARKICNEPQDGGLPASAVVELFGRNGSILGCSAQNAINKIKAYEEQQKTDSEIKVGDIITDGKINYLVIDITDKSYVALQGTDFEPTYIGKDYIKSYHNLHDSKDMRKIAEEINKAMKGEQQERRCISCEHYNSHIEMRCIHCRNYDKWELKGSED